MVKDRVRVVSSWGKEENQENGVEGLKSRWWGPGAPGNFVAH